MTEKAMGLSDVKVGDVVAYVWIYEQIESVRRGVVLRRSPCFATVEWKGDYNKTEARFRLSDGKLMGGAPTERIRMPTDEELRTWETERKAAEEREVLRRRLLDLAYEVRHMPIERVRKLTAMLGEKP